VARRISIDYLRAAAVRPTEISDEHMSSEYGDADTTGSVLAAHEVWKALGMLTKEHRQLIYERYFLDRPAKEIAERMGVPVGTVKSRVHYAIRALRNTLTERDFATAA
jgi:RNA polymerase sigma-70 factor (ECF subfamily)